MEKQRKELINHVNFFDAGQASEAFVIYMNFVGDGSKHTLLRRN